MWASISLLMSFSALMAGCANIERPDTNILGVNEPGLQLYGYNLKKDYDNTGKRKATAKPTIVQFQSRDEMAVGLNKYMCTDPDGFARLKAYIQKVRKYCE